MITNDSRCTREIKVRTVMAKATLILFTSKLDSNSRKKVVNYYIWSIVLYGAEN